MRDVTLQRLHKQLQHHALTYAREVKQEWDSLTTEERKEAMGWLKLYEHMLNNWEKA